MVWIGDVRHYDAEIEREVERRMPCRDEVRVDARLELGLDGEVEGRPGVTSLHASREPERVRELRMLLQLRPELLDVTRPQRDRTAPRGAVGGVGEADEAFALRALEQLDDRGETLLSRA